MRFYPIRLVSSQPKKPQGPVTLLKVTHLACLRSLSISQAALRGPRALGHVFGKRFVFGAYRDKYRGRSSLGQRERNDNSTLAFYYLLMFNDILWRLSPFFRISLANFALNRFTQNHTVSWQISISRSCKISST